MAHSPKKQKSNAEKIDQLIDVIGSLAQSVKEISTKVKNLEEREVEPVVDVETMKVDIVKSTPEMNQVPYVVMKVEAIIPNEGLYGVQENKKLFSGFKQFFNNRKEAGEFIDKMKQQNPHEIYEMYPA